MLSRTFTPLVVAVLALASFVRAAQSPTQLCAASITAPDLENADGSEVVLNYSTTDNTQFTVLYTFDYTYCKGIPMQGIVLTDDDTGATFTCTGSPTTFTSSNQMLASCGTTNGQMAGQGAYATLANWDILIKVGTRPNVLSYDVYFQVENTTPTASGTAARRRRAVQEGMVLPQGYNCAYPTTACPVPGRKGLWECLNLSSDINACGGCPGTASSQDCAIQEGVGSVACVAGTCAIQSCDRYHTISADGTRCIRNKPKLRFA